MAALNSRRGRFDFGPLMMPEPGVGGGGTVHVAVGKSVDKTVALLQWTFSMFPGLEICLLHVHRPSLLIPTLLGKLPASRANPATVVAFRNKERQETMKLLSTYLLTCNISRVKASIISTEADEVQKGIINLVNQHTIRKLVVGAIPDSMKGKKRSCKGCRISKHAPSYCDMWFVNKGKLIWTKQASASSSMRLTSCQLATVCTRNLRSQSLTSCQKEVEASSSSSLRSCNVCTPSALSSKTEEEGLCIQVTDLKGEIDDSKEEVYQILQEQKHYEVEVQKAFNKVNAFESAHAHESKLRIDAEEELRLTIQEEKKLFKKREEVTQQLEMTMRRIAVLNTLAQEADRRHEEAVEEWKLIRASIASLRKEKQRLQTQKVEAMRWLHRWRSHKQCEDAYKDKSIALTRDIPVLPEFLLSDLEAATCNFSESFKIGRGGYGIVYKGEMMDRTVVVKKLHSYNLQRRPEFHQEVHILCKLRHPHLVELIGTCPESWLLVSEYMPGGSLQEHLNSNDTSALNWKTRALIVANIASALLILHSFRPKKVIHGNLKPGNLLLDSEKKCKISDYADHMLTTGLTLRCPSFRSCSGSSSVCVYTDPESYRTGTLTHKSDIYSFGVIILELVTGKTDGGIVREVCRAFSAGEAASILDSSAGDWLKYVGRRLLELGLQCCQTNSRDRPMLTASLVKELECMPFLEEQAVPSFFLCPILREIMHDPQVASDGFTYEGEAIRGWLENGHDTSPMTNLKLSDINLSPNHSLRLAIQDWIANLKITS